MDSKRTKPEPTELRLDKWLWAARFFKTRGGAAKAVNGGKVQVGGLRAKPAKLVRVGDELRIRRGIYEYTVIVERLNERRRPASEARLLYTESEQSIQKREQLRAQRKAEGLKLSDLRASGRPDKRQRRQIIRLTRGE